MVERICQNPSCGKMFEALAKEVKRGNAKYCSRSCSSRMLRGRQVEYIKLTCFTCGVEFEKNPSRLVNSKHGVYFCGRKCKDEGQRLENGITAIQPHHYGTGQANYRKIASRHYDQICNRCGYAEYPEVLVVHHKDRNRDNNLPSNLEILCPTCHEVEHFSHGDGRFWGFGANREHITLAK